MKIYRQFKNGRNVVLHLGDCIKLLRKLPSESVDLTVTSPPYCMGKEYERTDRLNHFVEAHWKILPEIIRVTKAGGECLLAGGLSLKKGNSYTIGFRHARPDEAVA
jgi:adenine-specific DNA-methyltransferase